MKQALEALDAYSWEQVDAARTALKQAIAEAEKQEPMAQCSYPKCQATNGCVGACSKTAPVHASDISAERVDETAKDRHEPESNNVEIAAEQSDNYASFLAGVRFARVNLPAPSKEWVGLTDEAVWLEYQQLWPFHPAEEPTLAKDIAKFARAIEAKLKEKNGG
jgi:hypothetical protein